MKVYIGIDPGKKGSVAVLCDEFVEFIEMENFLASPYLIEYVEVFVAIEKAQAFPKQGTVSMFNYGKIYGQILGILKTLKIPFQEISPAVWKKEFSLIRKDKRESIQTAAKLFPLQEKAIKNNHHRAEALLLAEYARRKNM